MNSNGSPTTLIRPRAEQGQITLPPERINLGDLLEEILEIYRILAASNGREIAMRGDPECLVLADRKYLHQILHNLLTNALKHGEGNLMIRAACRGGNIHCTVANRIRCMKAPTTDGIGLGLRMVGALAARHEGMRFRWRRYGRWFAAHLAFSAGLEPMAGSLPTRVVEALLSDTPGSPAPMEKAFPWRKENLVGQQAD